MDRLALVALASVVIGFHNGLRLVDFQWLPVKVLAGGENPYLYSLHHLPFMGCQFDANYVPSCLALLTPFAFLSRGTANVVWDVCNLVFTMAFFFFTCPFVALAFALEHLLLGALLLTIFSSPSARMRTRQK